MATNTYKTFLMKGTGTGTITWAKLVDIKSSPAMLGNDDGLETTTMSDPIQKFIKGIQQVDASGLEFTANYDPTEFQTLQALEDNETDYAIWMGGTEADGVATPTGSEGKLSFKGLLTVGINEMGVNEVREMTIRIRPTTGISFAVGNG